MCVQVTALSHDELVLMLKRRSDGFSQGSIKSRGVSRQIGKKWESVICHQYKQVYLGRYNTELEAAQAYDRAAVRCKGTKAVTNFDANEYKDELTEFEELAQVTHRRFTFRSLLVTLSLTHTYTHVLALCRCQWKY